MINTPKAPSPPTSPSEQLEELAATPDLAEALASDRFKQFLDHVPVAILVSEIGGRTGERIVYVNRESETILEIATASLDGAGWTKLDDRIECDEGQIAVALGDGDRVIRAIIKPLEATEAAGRRIELNSVIVSDADDRPCFRLVALIDLSERNGNDQTDFKAQLRDKDLLLREIQHRVKNNLQIITALIRMEARRAGDQIGHGVFERLAGRIEALGLLYRQLELEDGADLVDLGALLSMIASSVIRAQAIDGVRLDLQVEPCLAGVDVAMPVGLLVNELLTNSMKYAFEGRTEGVVTVRCLKESDDLCAVTVADDGVGMAAGKMWPQKGKLGALMVRSLEDNTQATIKISTTPDAGVETAIRFRLTPSAAKIMHG